MAETEAWDVIVVGAGNAATCAALSAKEQGAKVLMLEKAPYDERGGNSLFTAGGFRFVHDGLDDLRTDILDDLTEGEVEQIGLPNGRSPDPLLYFKGSYRELSAD